MANLISEVLKADYRKYHQVNEELVEKLLNVMSFSELHTILVETIQKLTAPPVDDTPAPADLGAAMRAYISQNASSPTFSLVDVAEKFDLSVPYTSRFVKETTGITFTTFVQELRMARIRTALEQTKAPIKDIVTANGYYDVANFTRKFKKINGVTPTQYRQLHQRAGSKDDDAIL
jgi:YesN/AraC family two-component response regulator